MIQRYNAKMVVTVQRRGYDYKGPSVPVVVIDHIVAPDGVKALYFGADKKIKLENIEAFTWVSAIK